MADLLFLSHRIPYPPDKGDKIRAWHFLRHLVDRYRVHLAFFIDDPEDIRYIAALEGICATVSWRPLVPTRAKLRSLRGLFSGAPLTRGYFRDPLLQQAVDRVIAQHRPEKFFVFSSAMASYVEYHNADQSIIDMVDVNSEKWRHYAAATSEPMRLVYKREARTLLALERSAACQADDVIFVSRAEADLFRRLAPEAAARVRHINNGVDIDYFDSQRTYPNPFDRAPAIVFVGAMNYRPNVDAVTWFATNVMPALRSSTAPASFWIVGAHPNAAVRRLVASDIRITGRVADVRPYLAHAAAVVAPLRIAFGVQNKVLEAMAMAAPVIATPQAREGLDACRDGEIIEASTAPDFVEAIHRVLVAGGATIGRRARDRVCSDYNWEASFAALDARLEPRRAGESRNPRQYGSEIMSFPTI